MYADSETRKKHWWSLDSSEELEHEGHLHVVAEKHEVKHLRRIVKRGEKALRHMSEALEVDAATEKELDITRDVVMGVTGPCQPSQEGTPGADFPRFVCIACGFSMPLGQDRCPNCRTLYVNDPEDKAVDEDGHEDSGALLDGERVEVVKEMATSFSHFDVASGVFTCLKAETGESDFGLECHNCGAVTQFGADKCPLCGHRFDEWDTGLVGLLEGLKFDLDDDTELECPVCGEHVLANDGRCPSCREIVAYLDRHNPDVAVRTILKEKDVIFVHLDVSDEDIRFATKVRFQKVQDDQTVRLESIGKDGFDREWKGLARI